MRNMGISNRHEETIICQICNVSLSRETPAKRQAHYDEHFEDNRKGRVRPTGSHFIDLSGDTDGPRKPHMLRKGKEKASSSMTDKQNIFWHRSQDTRPPANFTPGLIPVIKQALLKSHGRGNTIRAALCYEGMVHVGTEPWDAGWGCGYRNFLMACTALMDQQVQPTYFPALDQPTPPGIRNLQQWIEAAWGAGFDPEGAAELKHKLVGTRKWIGTAELYVAFLYRGIPSRLVDFPRVDHSADAVLRWVENYFTSPLPSGMRSMKAKVKTSVNDALRGASPVIVTDRMPLVLQHDGHSRTIVGYEKLRNGAINLLCFDPARRPRSQIRESALSQYALSQGQSSKSSPSGKHGLSPIKLANRVLHPKRGNFDNDTMSSPSNKRRQAGECESSDRKRVRGGLQAQERDVIILDDDSDEPEIIDTSPRPSKKADTKGNAAEVDHSKVLDFFRLRPKKVGKNDQYQILYFPLEDVLTDQERWGRRIVTSDVVP